MESEVAAGAAATGVDNSPWSCVPSAPMTVEDTGIPEPFLRELMLKLLWAHDRPTLAVLSNGIGLRIPVVEELMDGLSRQYLCEVDSASGQARLQFRYRLTDRGKLAAHEALERSRYVGVAPVPVDAYTAMIKAQIRHFERPPLEDIRRALEHLVLPERLVEFLGQAFFSRLALMVYGPSGNGKTDIITSIGSVIGGTIVIPYALYAHGQLVRVFDSDVHKPRIDNEEKSAGLRLDEAIRRDRRWLPVARPSVIVGGDMGAEALEMTYDALQRVHKAALPVVGQGGVLLIDDLGRQKISPKEILNRWIIMMERGHDSFSLSTGEVVRLPLDVTLVFSTNLTLEELMDEAFLRRMTYKIAIPNPTRDELAEITRRFCKAKGLAWSEGAVQYLMERLWAPGLPAPRGCYPRDIITIVIDQAEFRGREPIFDRQSIDTALMLYLGTGDVTQEMAA